MNTVRGALSNPAIIADLERYIVKLERGRTVTESCRGLQTNCGHLSGGKQVTKRGNVPARYGEAIGKLLRESSEISEL